MARIHQLTVMAGETTDLAVLAGLLAEAVTISREIEVAPYQNPMVRYICYKIAFSGDGDLPVHEYYRDILQFAMDNADFIDVQGKEPSEPTRQAS
jgi:hypothetical protein